MKKLVLLGFFLISSTVMASVEETNICYGIADLAATIMQQRQDDVPLQAQELIALELEGDSKDVYELMVDDAYDHALFNTDLGKQQIVEKFRKRYLELCVGEAK